MDEQLADQLRQAYNLRAADRDGRPLPDWKTELRESFATLLTQEGKKSLLELGAGPGMDGRYFQDMGLDVLCTDLSPEMVRLCREKGLKAQLMDNTQFDLPPASFDAVYAMNSLLHLPKADLPVVLGHIQRVLKPDGLFFMGVYGGVDSEGVWEEDDYVPKRFFSFYTDDHLKRLLAEYFEVQTFTIVPYKGRGEELYHQSAVMRKTTSSS